MIDSEAVTLDVLKATVSRELLAEKVGIVSRALSNRASVLVLGGIHLRAAAGSLELAATDMEVSLRASLEAEIGGEGEVVVPGKLLLDIARALPEAEVSLEFIAEESVLLISSVLPATASTPTPPRTSPACRRSRRIPFNPPTATRSSPRSPASAGAPRATRAGRC